MNFHETVAGHRFFNHQLPELIKALQGVADALSQSQPVVHLPITVPPDFLENFYFGHYEPDLEIDFARTMEFNKAIIECQNRLRQQMSPEEWNRLEEYQSLLDQRASFDAEQSFEAGFRAATKMIAAGLSAPPESRPAERKTQDD